MSPILLRIVMLALGIGIAQMGLDALAQGSVVALGELVLALVLLVAGSAGFMVPLLDGSGGTEVSRDA
jgi:hypothetical protein